MIPKLSHTQPTTFLLFFIRLNLSISLMTSSSGSLKLEIHSDDKTPGKWSVPLGEDVFRRFLSGGGGSEKAVFGEGSIFSPFLFGKYFDPSDAFPLWDFEAEVLLASLRSLGQCRVDWSQTDQAYLLKSDLPGIYFLRTILLFIFSLFKLHQRKINWHLIRWWQTLTTTKDLT